MAIRPTSYALCLISVLMLAAAGCAPGGGPGATATATPQPAATLTPAAVASSTASVPAATALATSAPTVAPAAQPTTAPGVPPAKPFSPPPGSAPTATPAAIGGVAPRLTPAPPGKDTGMVDPLVTLAKQDLARRASVSESEITVVSTTPETWRDSSLGCPQPGMMYTQVITPGYRILLKAGSKQYEYHSDSSRRVVLCQVQ